MTCPSSNAVIVYDGQCPFCRDRVERMRHKDRWGCLEFVAWQSPEFDEKYPQLKGASLDDGMRVILPGGRITVAADAVYEVARRLPRWRRLAWLYRLPGLNRVFKKMYRWVANRRYRLGGR